MNKNAGRIRWTRLLLAMIAGMLVLTRTVDLHWHTHLSGAVGPGQTEPLTYLANASVPHLAADQDIDASVAGDEGGTIALVIGLDPPRKPLAYLIAAQRDAEPRMGIPLAALRPPLIHGRRLYRSLISPPLRAPPV